MAALRPLALPLLLLLLAGPASGQGLRVVRVDVRPGDPSNRVDPFSREALAVAVLGAEEFDVTRIDPASLLFGPAGAPPVDPEAPLLSDTDGDGLLDLTARFAIPETGIAVGDRSGCLVGATLDGAVIVGCGELRAVAETRGNGCGFGFATVTALPPAVWLRRRRRASQG